DVAPPLGAAPSASRAASAGGGCAQRVGEGMPPRPLVPRQGRCPSPARLSTSPPPCGLTGADSPSSARPAPARANPRATVVPPALPSSGTYCAELTRSGAPASAHVHTIHVVHAVLSGSASTYCILGASAPI